MVKYKLRHLKNAWKIRAKNLNRSYRVPERGKRVMAEFENYKKEKEKEDPEDKAIRIRLDKKRTKQPEER